MMNKISSLSSWLPLWLYCTVHFSLFLIINTHLSHRRWRIILHFSLTRPILVLYSEQLKGKARGARLRSGYIHEHISHRGRLFSILWSDGDIDRWLHHTFIPDSKASWPLRPLLSPSGSQQPPPDVWLWAEDACSGARADSSWHEEKVRKVMLSTWKGFFDDPYYWLPTPST